MQVTVVVSYRLGFILTLNFFFFFYHFKQSKVKQNRGRSVLEIMMSLCLTYFTCKEGKLEDSEFNLVYFWAALTVTHASGAT